MATILAAIIGGVFGIAGIVVTALLGRAATGRARRAEERAADLGLLTTLLDEQRVELDRRGEELGRARRELEDIRTENTDLRRRLEARSGG